MMNLSQDAETDRVAATEFVEAPVSMPSTVTQSPFHESRPSSIHVSSLLSTTLLCSNRALHEQGLSRLIAGFHKDLLAHDVLERLDQLRALPTTSTNHDVLVRELTEYLRFYSNHTAIIAKILALLKTLALEQPSIRPVLAETILEPVLAAALKHSDDLAIPLVVFLTHLLHPHDGGTSCQPHNAGVASLKSLHDDPEEDWKRHAVDRMLQQARVKDLILQTAERERLGEIMIVGCERLVTFLSSHLSRRSSLRHNLLAMDFIVAQLQFHASRVQTILREPVRVEEPEPWGVAA